MIKLENLQRLEILKRIIGSRFKNRLPWDYRPVRLIPKSSIPDSVLSKLEASFVQQEFKVTRVKCNRMRTILVERND